MTEITYIKATFEGMFPKEDVPYICQAYSFDTVNTTHEEQMDFIISSVHEVITQWLLLGKKQELEYIKTQDLAVAENDVHSAIIPSYEEVVIDDGL